MAKKTETADREHHGIEAVSCVFLVVWISAEILEGFGHPSLALAAYYGALVLPLWLLLYHFGKGWPKWKTLGIRIFVLVIAALLFLVFIISRLTIFYIECPTYLHYDEAPSRNFYTGFWCLHFLNDKKGFPQKVLSPVYDMFYLKFTNERDLPMTVEGFSVDTRDREGHWERVPIINVKPIDNIVEFFSTSDTNVLDGTNSLPFPNFKYAMKLNFHDDFLQLKMTDRLINSHETVQGWVLFDLPVKPSRGRGEYRLRIATADGVVSRPIHFGEAKQNEMDLDMVNNWKGYQAENLEDLYGIPLKYYSDNRKFPEFLDH